jgi:bloom syndrome protein
MALTATANDQVQGDVIARLGLKDCVRLRQSFNRKNLYYEVRAKTLGKTQISEIAAWIQNKHKGHTGIIYARTKLECENLAEELRNNYGISADFYHADMDSETKNQKLSNWQNGVTKIVVATVCVPSVL